MHGSTPSRSLKILTGCTPSLNLQSVSDLSNNCKSAIVTLKNIHISNVKIFLPNMLPSHECFSYDSKRHKRFASAYYSRAPPNKYYPMLYRCRDIYSFSTIPLKLTLNRCTIKNHQRIIYLYQRFEGYKESFRDEHN